MNQRVAKRIDKKNNRSKDRAACACYNNNQNIRIAILILKLHKFKLICPKCGVNL